MKSRRIENSGRSSIGTGTTSLLMIFTVLCFATLALLSLSTAHSNQNIQQHNIDKTAAQAAAEGEAATKLAELDAALAAADPATWADIAKSLGWQPTGSDGQFSCTVPSGEEHELTTTVALTPDGSGRYALQSQISRFIGEWTPGNNDQLWAG